MRYDVAVVGGGPGGLAAAIAARERDARVLVIERAEELGGILPQCIHTGFGVRVFGEDLTGPTYAQRYINRASELGVETLVDTMVLEVNPGHITATNRRDGVLEIKARAIVLAMGCRERPRGALGIPGTRPAGVYTAGTAQRLVNMEGYMPGERFVILGSGDIGMVMARRLTLEGAKVERVLEIQPFISGLRRNYVQCIQDFDIPLQLSHTVVDIRGDRRVEAVVAAEVTPDWQPIQGTEEVIPCDTLLLSVGLIPENELSRQAGVKLDEATGGPIVDERFQTSLPGIFAAGNVVHVYDSVDNVSRAGERAGEAAAEFALGKREEPDRRVDMQARENIRYVVPQVLDPESLRRGEQLLQMRVNRPVEKPVYLQVEANGEVIRRRRLRYVRPGEMVNFVLRERVYSQLRDVEEVWIHVEEANG
ncbi:MAG: FAD-dependent oxidoreductase [Chloroflexota bacterium]|nr:FAD-dependent oxidoreductase [Chloroflexota bacterium]